MMISPLPAPPVPPVVVEEMTSDPPPPPPPPKKPPKKPPPNPPPKPPEPPITTGTEPPPPSNTGPGGGGGIKAGGGKGIGCCGPLATVTTVGAGQEVTVRVVTVRRVRLTLRAGAPVRSTRPRIFFFALTVET